MVHAVVQLGGERGWEVKGVYTLPAIPGAAKELKVRVEVVRWLGSRVLLREIERPDFLIDCELDQFEAEIPEFTEGGGK